jgi:hypothetical protein
MTSGATPQFSSVIEIPSILHMKCRAVFGLALAPVVEAGGADVGVAEPLLDFRDVGIVIQGIRCRRGVIRLGP